MRIDQISVTNFRCFITESFVFSEPFTVLIGDNGDGKSALLDALSIGIGRALQKLTGKPPSLSEADVRVERYRHGSVVNSEPQYPVEIATEGRIENLRFRNSETSFELGVSSHEDDNSTPLIREIVSAVRAGEPRTVPVIAYYRTDRSWRRPTKGSVAAPTSRLAGYKEAYAATASGDSFKAWVRQRTGAGLEQGMVPEDLAAVLTALEHSLPEWNAVRYDFTEDSLLAARVEHGDEVETIRFAQLSDGQRALLGTMCDLAFRCVTLNPHLGRGAARETPGVVLIDELDLHLHPRWQRRVVTDLQRAFPEVQFITTTHSPFIVQALSPNALIDLTSATEAVTHDSVNFPVSRDFSRESIEDIAETAMGVPNPQWSRKRREMWDAARTYYDLVERFGSDPDSSEVRAARERLDELSIPFANDIAFSALLASEAAQRRR